MKQEETAKEQAKRLSADLGTRIFRASQDASNAAMMVAWGAIGCGDAGLAQSLFEQALRMEPPADEQARARRLAEWGGHAAAADSAAAAVALARLGLDWSWSAASADGRRPLAHSLMEDPRSRALGALLEQGLIDPLGEVGDAGRYSIRSSQKWIVWAATATPREPMGAGTAPAAEDKSAFERLLADPRVAADQEGLDEALWAATLYPDGERTAKVAARLLKNGADPFRPRPWGSRTGSAPPSGSLSVGGSWRSVRQLKSPLLAVAGWLSDAEALAAREREARFVSVADIKNAREEAEREAGKRRAAEGLPERPERDSWGDEDAERRAKRQAEGEQFAQLVETILRERLGEKGRQRLHATEAQEWTQEALEGGWCFANDWLCALMKEAEGDVWKSEKMWGELAGSVEWARTPKTKDGKGPLAFLMSLKGFGAASGVGPGSGSGGEGWIGGTPFNALLAAGCLEPAEEPENDPMRLALAMAAAQGKVGPWASLTRWLDETAPESVKQANLLSERDFASLARCLAAEATDAAERAVRHGRLVSLPSRFSNGALWDAMADRAATPALAERWRKHWAAWRADTEAMALMDPKTQAEGIRSLAERQQLLAEALEAPSLGPDGSARRASLRL
jgi:hypothetical protein